MVSRPLLRPLLCGHKPLPRPRIPSPETAATSFECGLGTGHDNATHHAHHAPVWGIPMTDHSRRKTRSQPSLCLLDVLRWSAPNHAGRGAAAPHVRLLFRELSPSGVVWAKPKAPKAEMPPFPSPSRPRRPPCTRLRTAWPGTATYPDERQHPALSAASQLPAATCLRRTPSRLVC